MFDAHTTAHEGEYLLSDRPWRSDDTERFVQRGCSAVVLCFTRAASDYYSRQKKTPITLDFLLELPNLRRVAVDGPISVDVAT